MTRPARLAHKKERTWRQTIAALKYYGLISDFGSKDRREFRLTDDARRYFLDERPEVHQELARKFALMPRAFATLWAEWKSSPPPDNIARSQLKIKFGYSENSAPLVLSIYKANLAFAKLPEVADDSRMHNAYQTRMATPAVAQLNQRANRLSRLTGTIRATARQRLRNRMAHRHTPTPS